MTDVVVTGMGAVTPLGVGARTLHERWSAGDCGVEDGEAAASDFEATDFLSVKDARRSDRFTQFALAACQEALDEAGWNGDRPYASERIGCVIGTGIGGITTLEGAHAKHRDEGAGAVPPLAIPLMLGNAGAATLAMHHGLRGPTYGLVSACAAGGHALGDAARLIRSGDADAAVAGGSEAALTPFTRAAFAALDATSDSGVSRPFDARRDGFIMGEGAGVLILESAEGARERGAEVLGVVRGYGATCDAFHLTAPDAEGAGAAAAITAALADAGIDPSDVDYVNAHGTSTPLNDRAETLAIKRALGEHAGEIPVSSTKSAIGHLLGGAGAVEAIATILALRDRVAPPTVGWGERDEDLDLDYVPDEVRQLDVPSERPAIGISNSFGFGGHNAVIVLEAA